MCLRRGSRGVCFEELTGRREGGRKKWVQSESEWASVVSSRRKGIISFCMRTTITSGA